MDNPEIEEGKTLNRFQRFDLLITSMPVGFALHEIILDEKGTPCDYRFLEINPAFEGFTGLKGRDIIGKTVLEVIPALESFWIERYGKVALEGETIRFEQYAAPLDRYYEVIAYCPKQGQFVALFSEITDRKKAEAEREFLIADLEAKNVELEQFTYTVSHDLKSPLITIKGFLGLLEQDMREGKTDSLDNYMERISNAVDKMSQLLSELLELSRIGRLENPAEWASFTELAQEALDLVSGQLTQKNIEVTIAPNLPRVFGDRTRLRAILENLLSNAAKFNSEEADPQVEIGSRLDGDERVFYVQDNGIGIDSRYHERIFDLFEKLQANSEGSGVGLTIVKRIVEVHGGRIWVESDGIGNGATFCFTLSGVEGARSEHGDEEGGG